MKKSIEMEVGVNYLGYGRLNEFGEFEFTPQQKGAHKGRIRNFKTGQNWSIKLSDKLCLINLNLNRRQDRLAIIKQYISTMKEILEIFNQYEI